jgi:uncharacterized protein YpmB
MKKETISKIIGTLAAMAIVSILIGAIVYCVVHENHNTHNRIVQANNIVRQNCGPERQRQFRSITGGESSYRQLDEARDWAINCISGK